jgi:signal peptidase I
MARARRRRCAAGAEEGGWARPPLPADRVPGALILRSFIVAPFSIPSGSMLPRLMIGDYLFVSKWPYGYSRYSLPFGVVDFDGRIWGSLPSAATSPCSAIRGRGDEDFVKRVIGLPGDTVQMRGGHVILNGKPVPQGADRRLLMPVTPNSPCRPSIPAAMRSRSRRRRQPFCAYPATARRCRAARSSTRSSCSTRWKDPCRADNTALFTRAGRPLLRDGRQSRRQHGQPLPPQPSGVGFSRSII